MGDDKRMMICAAWAECRPLRAAHGVLSSHHCEVHEQDQMCKNKCPYVWLKNEPKCREATDGEQVYFKMLHPEGP